MSHDRGRSNTSNGLLAVVVAIVAMLPFLPAIGNGFTNWDDPSYLTQNVHVRGGLTSSSIAWAFTTIETANWHPLTWLSHQLDWTLFGPRAAWHHAVSIVFHAISAALLFSFLSGATGRALPSVAAALLWAVHPLRVESVVWASERKDVLSTFFWVAGLCAYLRYCRRPGPRALMGVVALAALGLLTKPMLVTYPFVLLLLDRWPLARFRSWMPPRHLLIEKLPLFALAAASSIVTMVVQKTAMPTGEILAFPWRAANAVVSYVAYLGKTALPIALSPFYPHPGTRLSLLLVLGSTVTLATLTLVALKLRARAPYLETGWFWYLGTLVPVIGLVQVGSQSMADRYTYVPSIGLAIAITWGIDALLGSHARRFGALAAILAVLALAGATVRQVLYWKDSETLFTRALELDPDNPLAHNNLGIALEAKGRTEEALQHYRAALRVHPHYLDARGNLAMALVWLRRPAEAEGHLRALLEMLPDNVPALAALGKILADRGEEAEALPLLEAAAARGSSDPDLEWKLAWIYIQRGRFEDARRTLEDLLRQRPDFAPARSNLAAVYKKLGRWEDARRLAAGGSVR